MAVDPSDQEPTRPEFIVDSGLAEEDRATLQALDSVITNDPDFAQRSFDVYMRDPEATGQVISLLLEHPEGLAVMGVWKEVIEKRLDTEGGRFDAATEEAIDNDTYYKSLRKDFQAKGDEETRTKMRKRSMSIFINRKKLAA